MQGLLRIILVDSFIAGKRVVADLDGHAALSGGNGAGKTTFLVLLPMFYGAEPRQVDQAVSERTLLAKQNIKHLERRIKEFDNRLQDHQEALKSEHDEALNELLSQHAIDRTKLDADLEALAAREAQEKAHHTAALKDIWADFDALCSEKGIDTTRFSEARAAYQALSAEVGKVEDYGKLVREYRSFLEHQWPRLPQLNDDLSARKRQLAVILDERVQAQARYKADEENLGQQIKHISGELNARRGLLSEANHLLDRSPGFPAVVEPAEGSPRYLIDQFSSRLDEYQRERDAIKKRVLSAENRLNRSGDEGIRDSWQRLCAEKESALGTTFNTDPVSGEMLFKRLSGADISHGSESANGIYSV